MNFKLISYGAFSKVYLYNDQEQKYALKLVKPSFKKIEREILIHKDLIHEFIVKLIDFSLGENVKCLILEYCNNGDLLNFQISEDLIHSFFIKIVNGLSYIHSKGIIHRDIKPENIMIKNGIPKIGDFGLSTICKNSFIKSGRIGTLNYCSQEIIKSNYYNQKTDIWSLGCTLYFIEKKRYLFKSIEDITNYDFFIENNVKNKELIKLMLRKNPFLRPSCKDIINVNFSNEEDSNYREVTLEVKELIFNVVEKNGINIIRTTKNIEVFRNDLLIIKHLNKSLFKRVTNIKIIEYNQEINICDIEEDFTFHVTEIQFSL